MCYSALRSSTKRFEHSLWRESAVQVMGVDELKVIATALVVTDPWRRGTAGAGSGT